MAQYFQVINQTEKPIDDEPVNLYPNIIENDQSVQYVLSPDDHQIPHAQSIIVSGDQFMLLDNADQSGNRFPNQQLVLETNDYQNMQHQGQQVIFMETSDQSLESIPQPPQPVVLNQMQCGRSVNVAPNKLVMALPPQSTMVVQQSPIRKQSTQAPTQIQGQPRYQYKLGMPSSPMQVSTPTTTLGPAISRIAKETPRAGVLQPRLVTPAMNNRLVYSPADTVPPLNRIGQVSLTRATKPRVSTPTGTSRVGQLQPPKMSLPPTSANARPDVVQTAIGPIPEIDLEAVPDIEMVIGPRGSTVPTTFRSPNQLNTPRGGLQTATPRGILPQVGTPRGGMVQTNVPRSGMVQANNLRGGLVQGNTLRGGIMQTGTARGGTIQPIVTRGNGNPIYSRSGVMTTATPRIGIQRGGFAPPGIVRGGLIHAPGRNVTRGRAALNVTRPMTPSVRPTLVGRGRGANQMRTNVQTIDDDKVEVLQDGNVVSLAEYQMMFAADSNADSNDQLNQVDNSVENLKNSRVKSNARGGGRNNRGGRGTVISPQLIPQDLTNQNAVQQQPPIQNPVPFQPQSNELTISNESQESSPIKCTKTNMFKNFVPPPEIKEIISKTPVTAEFQNSVRMFVLLANGEQRLITFTVPKEHCTIHEILEQVGVPFQPDTEITCAETNADGINYVVTVGLSQDALDDFTDVPRRSSSNVPALPKQLTQSVEPPKAPTPELVPLSEPELPKYIKGMVAVCNYCGFLSDDFNKCLRCKRSLPDNIKAMPTANVGKLELAKQRAGEQKKPIIAIHLKNNGIPKVASPRKLRSRPKVVEHEPVILTLSSDDDDDDEERLNVKALEQIINSVELPSEVLLHKEPSIKDLKENTYCPGITGGGDEIPANITADVFCRTVRIGSYRFTPLETVKISNKEITLMVPCPRNPKDIKTIIVERKSIVKVLVNFHKILPVIFYYIVPGLGEAIRNELGMVPGVEPYFDPLSEEEPFRRITLLPEIIEDELKATFKLIYGPPNNLMDELNTKEANNILIRTMPKEISKTITSKPTETSMCDVKQLLIFPPGVRGAIPINTEDFQCLAQDQFLNDVIIDFYIKYLIFNMPVEQQEKVHVFSTFFYKRLTTKPPKPTRRSHPAELDPNLTAAQKRHFRVKNWTKHVNLFEKDFVVVPINENAHWFLAIICFPGMDGPHTLEGKPYKVEPLEKKKKVVGHIGNVTITQIKVEKSVDCEGDQSDKDEAEGDDSEWDSNEENVEEESEVVPPSNELQTRVPIKQPCILIFDSLAGTSRARVVATLRDYLTCEHTVKRNSVRVYNKDVIKGACPKVPQQTNYTDCGLYLLQYVESFFQVPVIDYHIPINELKGWFEEITVTRKREDISILIRELMIKYGKDIDEVPDILLPTINGELVEKLPEDEDEDNFEDEEEAEDEEMESEHVGAEEETKESYNEMDDCTDTETNPISSSQDSDASEATPSKPSLNSAFMEQLMVDTLKPDVKEQEPLQSTNRDTMSYLKAKRIIRHKGGDNGADAKRFKSLAE